MTEPARRRTLMAVLIAIAAGVFLTGINWGLPSRWVDPYLFGDEPVWSGEKILSLAPSDANTLGADVDANPLAKRSYPIVLNDTDETRAEIIRRYRLFSHQPDEMITFKSLARIKQFKGDPRLYQYGGLWMYPVGAMLAVADLVGYVDLRGGPEGQAYYLDHPEAFGRFYVVARLYTVLWGLIGVWAVFWIVHRLTASDLAAAVGALCYAFMPVVVNMAHEAKPHLPGAVLMLLSVIAATKFVETGRTRWWVLTGALCGAAFGMVISCLVGFAVILIMTLLRDDPWPRRINVMFGATMVGFAVYFVTNPYVLINGIAAPEILRSNLSNSTAMYGKRGLGGIGNGLLLVIEGASIFVFVTALMAGFHWLIEPLIERVVMRTRRSDHAPFRPPGWLLLCVASLVGVQFLLLAEGKPAEYARFAIVLDVTLAIIGVAALHALTRGVLRSLGFVALVVGVAYFSLPYLRAFVADSGPRGTRQVAARQVQELHGHVEVIAEPAPYSCPPVNLFQRSILLVRPAEPLTAQVRIAAVDDRDHMPNASISWANKRFVIDTK
jgi:hypothetical protein